jgi:hypothetical protein
LSLDRLVFAQHYAKHCQRAHECFNDLKRHMNPVEHGLVLAPKGHGKTHFVFVLASVLALMYPNVVIAYFLADKDDVLHKDTVPSAAILMAHPELEDLLQKTYWRHCLQASNRTLLLFVDEVQNWFYVEGRHPQWVLADKLFSTDSSCSNEIMVALGSYSFLPSVLIRGNSDPARFRRSAYRKFNLSNFPLSAVPATRDYLDVVLVRLVDFDSNNPYMHKLLAVLMLQVFGYPAAQSYSRDAVPEPFTVKMYLPHERLFLHRSGNPRLIARTLRSDESLHNLLANRLRPSLYRDNTLVQMRICERIAQDPVLIEQILRNPFE